jgi:CRP-like cAMP-binding protein
MLIASLSTPTGLLAGAFGVLAASLFMAGALVRTMVPLRWLQVGGNFGFIACGALLPSLPMLALHVVLLPVNAFRAVQMTRLARRVTAAAQGHETTDLWLQRYMKRRRHAAGDVIFRQGDAADRLYMLAAGRIELMEIGVTLGPGRIFGELAFFAPGRHRTLTARCLEPCLLLSIDENTMRQLYYQNPGFGFELIGLVAGRLFADVGRLEAELAAARAALAGVQAAHGAGAVPLRDGPAAAARP